MLQQILAASKPDSIETHPCWKPFKSSMRIKRDILSGKKDEALNEAIELSNMLSLIPGESIIGEPK
jgi:hypothetical protein